MASKFSAPQDKFLPGLGDDFLSPINDFLLDNFEEVSPFDFYRDIFPVGSFEKRGEYVEGGYNGIACEIIKDGDKTRVKRYTITDDLEKITELIEGDNFVITSPISYAGKARKSTNARFLHALTIDLDGVEINDKFYAIGLSELVAQMESSEGWCLPMATYLVSSGTGIHIYWVFEKPIPLFKNVVEELEKFKRRLTWQVWARGASTLYDHVQYRYLVMFGFLFARFFARQW